MNDKYISENGEIELCEIKGKIYLRLKEHKPIIIHADDKYRKGLEIDICHDCGNVTFITEYQCSNSKTEIKRCSDCSYHNIEKEVKKCSKQKKN